MRPPMTAWGGGQRQQSRQHKRAVTSYNHVRHDSYDANVEQQESLHDNDNVSITRPYSSSSISSVDVILAQRLEEVLRAPHETMVRVEEHSDDDDYG
jgi:hypothetical protein